MSTQAIFHWLLTYRYSLVIPIVAIEGPIATVITGALAAFGYFNLWFAFLLVVIGEVLGDLLYYALGRWGRSGFLNRFGKFFGVDQTHVDEMKNHFDKHSGKTFFMGKVLHGIGVVVLVAAGAAEVPIPEFIWYNFLATLPKSLLLLLLGFYFAQAYAKIGDYLSIVAIAIIILALIGVSLYIKSRKKTVSL
jgi:membrane protein DedA with SNARE-associated domain